MAKTLPNGPVRARPRSHVTSTLAKQILSGAWAPGNRLPTEHELGETLGVSRTALRESIRILAGKGLIESRTRSGTVVQPSAQWNHLDSDLLAWREELEPDLDFVRGLTEARQVIEPAAAAFAAMRATGQDLGRIEESYNEMCRAQVGDIEAFILPDQAFHLAVLTASQNPVFINFGAMVGSALRNAFRLTTSATDNYVATLDMHGRVLEAIRMRRPDEAGKRMADLLDLASRDLAKVIAQGSREK